MKIPPNTPKISEMTSGKAWPGYVQQIIKLWLFQLLLILASIASVSAAGLEISVATEDGISTVPAGDTKHLSVTYNWPSLTQNLTNAKITIPLPAEFDTGLVQLFNSAHVASSSFDSGTRTITYTMIDPLPAGSSGTFRFCVRFPNGSTAPGTTGTITATSSATGQPPNSSSVTLTAKATTRTGFAKRIGNNPAPDQKATYFIDLANNMGAGNLNLLGTVVTDTLPAGVEFISANNGGVYDGAGHVTWNLGLVDVFTDKSLRVTVRFPSSLFSTGMDVTNTAALTATVPGGASVNLNASVTSPISPPNAAAETRKNVSDSISSLKAGLHWTMSVVNKGNVELSNYVLTDEFPKEFIPWIFYYGSDYYGTESTQVAVEYKTTLNSTWTTAPGSPFTTSPGYDSYVGVWELGLATGEVVTATRYTYAKVPVGYDTSWSSRVNGYIGDQITGLDRDGNVIAPLPRDPVSNTLNYSWEYNGTTTTGSSSASTKLIDVSAKPDLDKYVSASNVQPTDTILFQTYLKNNNASEPLKDPVFADLLAPELDYVAGSFTTNNALTGGTLEVIPNYNGTGRTMVRCSYPGQSIPVWNNGLISFNAKVKAGTAIGSYSNTAYLAGASNALLNTENVDQLGPDTLDLDGDGNTTENVIGSNTVSWNCVRYAAIDSVKWVKGELDADFHRYPDVGQTNANGTFTYKLIVTNPGNVPLNNIKIMDILPYVGDHGVILTNATRDSAYTPYLTTAVTAPVGITALYSTSRNPVRSELDATLGDPTGGVVGSFSATAPSDLKTVGSLLFDFGSLTLAPLESKEITWSMTAPLSVVPGQVAWNSFGHRSTAADGGAPPPPSEPIKVGVTVPAAGAAEIGNFVWLDANANGIQDSGEVGLPNVLVKLCDSNGVQVTDIAGNPVTTTTDSNGLYHFGVPAGTYSVQFVIPSGYAVSPRDVTTGATEATDSDASPTTGKTGNFTVALNTVNPDIDLGLYLIANLGNVVFCDTNDDGLRDADGADNVLGTADDEPGIQGVVLILCDASGTPVDNPNIAGVQNYTTTTDSNGEYYFVNLNPGSYTVKITTPPSSKPNSSTSTDTADNGVDNNDNGAQTTPGGTITSPVIVLTAGETDNTVDFGLVKPLGAALGNLVFCDYNNDGVRDADGADNVLGTADDEPGIQGVVLTLCDASGTPVDNPNLAGVQDYTATTDSNGQYNFTGLTAGSYTVKIATPPSSKPNSSTATDTADNGVDNNDNGAQSTPGGAITSPVIVLTAGETDDTVDFGLVAPAKANLGNLVFCDTNNDGVRDADGADNVLGTADDEPGIQGVVLTLCDASGTPVDNPNIAGVQNYNATTDSNGQYNFLNLDAGSYTVKITTPPSSKPNSSTATDTADNGVDNNDNGAQSTPGGAITSPVIVLTAGETDDTVDFGLVAPAKANLGNLVFCDTNNDGVRDADGADNVLGTADDEPGIQGVVLTLCDASGTPVDNPNLAGVQDYTSTTDSNGQYNFLNLDAGSYTVKITTPPSSKPNSSTATDTADNGVDNNDNGSQSTSGGTITSPVIVLVAGETDDTVDFGLVAPAKANLGNLVFCDTNNDGVRDADGADDLLGTADDEPGIQGVVLTLCDASGTPVDNPNIAGVQNYTATTDSNGQYNFLNLDAGSYTVKIVTPPSSKPNSSTATDTADNGVDNNDNGSQTTPGGTITSPVIVLTAGETDDTVDFGLVTPPGAALGNLVFCDTNNDGVRDADGADNVLGTEDDEPGIQGVVVTLCDASGTPVDNPNVAGVQNYTVTTDTNGLYSFTGLVAGSYTVKIVTPPSSKPNSSTATDTADNGVDNNDNGAQTTPGGTVTSPVIVLTAGETDDTVDFGLWQPASLGNLVFCDTNNDGVRDADGADNLLGTIDDEPGIQDVILTLCDASGNPVDNPNIAGVQNYTVTADSNGAYSFSNLLPGDYIVKIVTPPSAKPKSSTSQDSADNGVDNNNNGIQPVVGGAISSGIIHIAPGENEPTIDFGLTTLKPTNWAAWQSLFPLGGQNGPTQNPDGDIYDNLQEFAFCKDPSSGVNTHCPLEIRLDKDGFIYAQVTKVKDIVGLTYTLEYISDLSLSGANGAGWTPVTTIIPVDTDNNDGTLTSTYANLESIPALANGKGFVRVKLDLASPATTSRTYAAGWMDRTITGACETYSNPFLECEVFSGLVDSNTASSINVATAVGTGSFGAALLTGKSYYVEVLSGALAGHRWNVVAGSTVTTIAVGAGTKALTANALAGASVIVREAKTIGGLFAPSLYQAGSTPNNSDKVLIYDPNSVAKWSVYYLADLTAGGLGIHWVKQGDNTLASQDNLALDACQGIYLHHRTAAITTTQIGHVRQNPMACPLSIGQNLVGTGYPMDQSYVNRAMTWTGSDFNGFTGSVDPVRADNVLFWKGDTTLNAENYTTHWLVNAGFNPYRRWSLQGDNALNSQDSNKVFKATRGSFYKSLTGNPNYVLPTGWIP